jgi:hypothetical protein
MGTTKVGSSANSKYDDPAPSAEHREQHEDDRETQLDEQTPKNRIE